MVRFLDSVNGIHQFLVIWCFLSCLTSSHLFSWIGIAHDWFQTKNLGLSHIHFTCYVLGCVWSIVIIYTLILKGPMTLILVISLCILWHISIVNCSWLWSTQYMDPPYESQPCFTFFYGSIVYYSHSYLYHYRYGKTSTTVLIYYLCRCI